MEKLVYQMFITGRGKCLDEALRCGLGGVIFFTKDIEEENQFKNLINEIKKHSFISPFLSIDQEGGRVERTENIRPKRLSARDALKNGESFLKVQSEEISRELKEWGINLNFAPCIDINTNPNNPIIDARAFSDNAEDVIKGGGIFIEASRKYGIIPCVKHFPGHGDADKDSHLTLPVIKSSLEEHIKPFKAAIDNNIEMIMVAHLHCTYFDKEPIPASLSKNVVGYLRNNLNYKGVIITDDMVMKGVQDFGNVEACTMAINAGVDMFIYRDCGDKVIETINELVKIVEQDEILQKRVIESNKRIKKLKSGI